MKNLLYAFTFVFIFCSSNAIASNNYPKVSLDELYVLSIHDAAYVTKIDSGFFSTVKKGYQIANKMTIDDVGKIASIVLFNNNNKFKLN